MRHWRTIGNSNVAIQTGSTYSSDNVIDVTTIPTANLGFSTRASSQKVSTSDYNIERQPEIAIWPPKLEIVIPLELERIEQSRWSANGKSMASPNKMLPSDCDNDRQPEMAI